MQTTKKIDVHALLHLLKRRKWFVIVPLILASIGGYIRIITLVSEYKSTATILIGRNWTLTQNMSNVLPGIEARDKVKMRDRKETLTKQLLSNVLLSKVVEKAGLKPSKSQIDRARKLVEAQPALSMEEAIRSIQAASLKKKIEIIFPRRGDYIEVSAVSADPEKAYLVTKHLVAAFIDDMLLQELSNVQGTLEFSQSQLKIYRKKMNQAEMKLRRFKQNMAAAKGDDVPINPTNVEHVKSLIASNAVEISNKIKNASEIDRQLGRLATEIRIRRTNRSTQIRALLIEKIADLAKLMVSKSWSSGDILRLNSEIASLKEKLRDEIQKNGAIGLRGHFRDGAIELAVQKEVVQADIALLQAQQRTLMRLMDAYNSHSKTLPIQEVTLQKLQADYEKSRELYQTFSEQVRSAQITGAMQELDKQIRYRIIDPAQLPTEPVTASTNQVILVALLMGLGIGAGFIYLLEFIDQSFKSVDDVEDYLGLIVLGTVPKIDFNERAAMAKKQKFSLV